MNSSFDGHSFGGPGSRASARLGGNLGPTPAQSSIDHTGYLSDRNDAAAGYPGSGGMRGGMGGGAGRGAENGYHSQRNLR